MLNKVVARFADGHMVKGTTADFFPNKDAFHITRVGQDQASEQVEVRMRDLKALFFVRDLDGNPDYSESHEFDPGRPAVGRKIRVIFCDGEVMTGLTQGYQSGRPGFFVEPADPLSNNERCYVVSAATTDVAFI